MAARLHKEESGSRLVLIDVEGFVKAVRAAVENSTSPPPPMPPPGPSEPWLTIGDAASHAAVSEDTVREWIRLGQLPFGRAGRVLRVRRSDIDALLLSGGAEASGDADAEPMSARAADIVKSLQGKGDG